MYEIYRATSILPLYAAQWLPAYELYFNVEEFISMNIRTLRKGQGRETCWYIVGCLVSILYCFWALNLWNYDFNVPFWYCDGDNMSTLLITKRLKDGFFATNLLGAPFQALLVDYPLYGDTFNYLVRGVILALTRGNAGLTINIFYVLLFPATFCTSFYVLRKLGGRELYAFFGSLLFTALPYRFLRGTAHLDLSNFTFIPVTLYLCWLIYSKEKNLKYTKKKSIWLGLCLIPVALSGIYYAFFSCFFICVTFVLRFFKDRHISKSAIACVIGIAALIVVAMIPTLYYQHVYGTSAESPTRSPIEAEIYGLKIAQFFIPNQTHGSSILEKLITNYNNAPVPNEGSEYLGIVGAIGLLLSLLCVMGFQKTEEKVQLLGKLNLFAILLATVGGFGSIFALAVSPQIRGYNRISVFVGFFSIATVVMLLSKAEQSIKWKKLMLVGTAVIACFSLTEQTLFQGDALAVGVQDYYSDQAFVEEIEEYASEEGMIYQYPYYRYPETPPMNQMGDYALARGYVHSGSLKWSYGDYKGQDSDLWNRSLSEKSIPEQIECITVIGFEGIYIDTFAYTSEELEDLINQIETTIGAEDIRFSSENGRLIFYGLHTYRDTLESMYADEELSDMKSSYLISVQYSGGFSGLEGTGEGDWRWCDKTGELTVQNPTDEYVTVQFSATAYTGYEEISSLTIMSEDDESEYRISSAGTAVEYTFTVHPGENQISFSTDAQRVDAPTDPRSMYFRLENATIEVVS